MKWRLPAVLVAAGLFVVIAWSGLTTDERAVITPTPTKTPTVVLAAEAAVSRTPVTSETDRPMATPSASPTQKLLSSATPTDVSTPSPSPLPTWTPSVAPTATPSPPPTETFTPIPTFTPPPHQTSSAPFADHYRLERPISPEYANWIDRTYPYGSTRGGTLRPHHGVEFYNPVGVPVHASGSGVVVTAGTDRDVLFGPQANFYGNLVVIRHDELYREQYLYTLYGHLSDVLVSEGQPVATGDLIGLVGGTGAANGGAHLHFEVRVGENSYQATRNPELWIKPFPGWGTIAGQLLWPDGSYVQEAALLLRRADDPSLFVSRTIPTYAGDSVNPDDQWQENFTSPDLEPGPYEVVFRRDGVVLTELVWIYPNQTSFVSIQSDAFLEPDS